MPPRVWCVLVDPDGTEFGHAFSIQSVQDLQECGIAQVPGWLPPASNVHVFADVAASRENKAPLGLAMPIPRPSSIFAIMLPRIAFDTQSNAIRGSMMSLDEDGVPLVPPSCVSLPVGSYVATFLQEIFDDISGVLLRGVYPMESSVYESREVLRRGGRPLAKDMKIAVPRGIEGKQHFVVTVPLLSLKAMPRTRNITYEVVNEDGGPLLKDALTVSLPTGCLVTMFQRKLSKQSRR